MFSRLLLLDVTLATWALHSRWSDQGGTPRGQPIEFGAGTEEWCAALKEKLTHQKHLSAARKNSTPLAGELKWARKLGLKQRKVAHDQFGTDMRSPHHFGADMWSDKTSTSCQLSTTEMHHAKCPPGYYLGHDDADIETRHERLRNALCKAKNRGWTKPLGNTAANDGDEELLTNSNAWTRGYMTFESTMWGKDSTCHMVDPNFNVKTHFKPDAAPSNYMKERCEAYSFEFLKSWKVASMTFPTYLDCEYSECDWKEVSVQSEVVGGTIVATAVREPVSRWISAMGELLERALNGYCPLGECGASDGFVNGDESTEGSTLNKLQHTTTWYPLINSSEGGFTSGKLTPLVKAFVDDTHCNLWFYASEHFSTQSNFVTQNVGQAQNISEVIKLESQDEDLEMLSQLVRGSGSTGSCSLTPDNVAACKPTKNVLPTSAEIEAALNASSDLMETLCLVYAQDFICFDYDLPAACKGLF